MTNQTVEQKAQQFAKKKGPAEILRGLGGKCCKKQIFYLELTGTPA